MINEPLGSKRGISTLEKLHRNVYMENNRERRRKKVKIKVTPEVDNFLAYLKLNQTFNRFPRFFPKLFIKIGELAQCH